MSDLRAMRNIGTETARNLSQIFTLFLSALFTLSR
jgi:hypothetical protein